MPKYLPILAFLFAVSLFGQSFETRQQFAPKPATLDPAKALQPQPLFKLPEPAPAPKDVPVRKVAPVRPFEPDFSLGLGLSTKYFRDGWCQNSSPVFTQQAEITESGLYLGVRSTYNFSDKAGRRRRFQDDRLYMGYGMKFVNAGIMGPVLVDICWTYNQYPGNSNENSGEVSLAFLLDEIYQKGIFALTGGLTLCHNYGKNETYAIADITTHFALNEKGTLQLENGFLLYWGDTRKMQKLTDDDCDGNAFYTIAWHSAIPWAFAEHWSLEPFVEVDCHPDGRARDAARSSDFNSAGTFWGGIRLNCCF